MKVLVDGCEFDTDQVEIIFNDGGKLLIDPYHVSVSHDGDSLSDAHVMEINELFNRNIEKDEEDEEDEEDGCVVGFHNGSMEIHKFDGTISYFDNDGNCCEKWIVGDWMWKKYKDEFFPDVEIKKE